MRFALIALCVATPLLLISCADDAPSGAPADIDAHLTQLTDAIAALEQAIDTGAPEDHIIHVAGNVRRLAAIKPDETWTDAQRQLLLDLLKRSDGMAFAGLGPRALLAALHQPV